MHFPFSRFVLSFLIFCHRVLQAARSVQKEGNTEEERVRQTQEQIKGFKPLLEMNVVTLRYVFIDTISPDCTNDNEA